MSIRSDKVRLTLRKAVSEIISYEHNFNVLVSVSDIDMSPDLSNAKIYISILGDDNSKLNVINELNKILSIKESINLKKNGLLKNKTFMLTGKLDGMSRAEAKSLIEQNSGSIISNVSKKLDYLIVGEKPTKRKIEHAKELGIEILSQDQWLKLLNKRI